MYHLGRLPGIDQFYIKFRNWDGDPIFCITLEDAKEELNNIIENKEHIYPKDGTVYPPYIFIYVRDKRNKVTIQELRV